MQVKALCKMLDNAQEMFADAYTSYFHAVHLLQQNSKDLIVFFEMLQVDAGNNFEVTINDFLLVSKLLDWNSPIRFLKMAEKAQISVNELLKKLWTTIL
jgi:hypothetical protein